jgi:predicted AAA+ superfamily ATPase
MPIRRRLHDTVIKSLSMRPVVVLLGPRQVGKTTLAREIAESLSTPAIYLDLERPADLRRLEDADAFLRSHTGQLCVIDEVQRLPELFPILRGVIDERRREGETSGQCLLLGSAALELVQRASETLAGRVSYIELSPFDVSEVSSLVSVETLWSRGGFPDSLLAITEEESSLWREDFIRSYLDRDIPFFAPRLPGETIGRLWTMLAHAQGTPVQASRFATSLGVSANAVGRYIDLLVDLLLVRRLQPWSANIGKRLVRSPKIYLRDSGLMHALLEINDLEQLLGHVAAGMSWEGFVLENLIQVAGRRYRPFFYRTEDGAEIDLLLERAGRLEWAIEIKRSSAPHVSKGFHLACELLQPRRAVVIHGGRETWMMPKGIEALSLLDATTVLLRES